MLTGVGKGVKKHTVQPFHVRHKLMRQIGNFFILPDPGNGDMPQYASTQAYLLSLFV